MSPRVSTAWRPIFRERLFIDELGMNSIGVVDIEDGKVMQRLARLEQRRDMSPVI